MSVTPEEREAMSRLLSIVNGEKPSASLSKPHAALMEAELPGAGQVTSADVKAMSEVLQRLNKAIGDVSNEMLAESTRNPEVAEALVTTSSEGSVKIGRYEIRVNLDESRLVNKQNYSVVNKLTGETLANELGLYEAAHGLVKLLNAGQYINSPVIRDLLEAEAAYTSHKMDALRFKRRSKKSLQEGNQITHELYETRRVDAMDKAMQNKARVKKIYNSI